MVSYSALDLRRINVTTTVFNPVHRTPKPNHQLLQVLACNTAPDRVQCLADCRIDLHVPAVVGHHFHREAQSEFVECPAQLAELRSSRAGLLNTHV